MQYTASYKNIDTYQVQFPNDIMSKSGNHEYSSWLQLLSISAKKLSILPYPKY